MIAKLSFTRLKSTVLALDRSMCFLFMLFLLTLGNELTALATLVVHACTTDLVHSELAYFNCTIADAANLRFFLRGLHLSTLFFKCKLIGK